MLPMSRSAPVILALVLLASGTAGQDGNSPARGPRLDAEDHAVRTMVHELQGGEIGAPLPPVYEDSPRDDIVYADRFPVHQSYQGECDGTDPTILDKWIPKTEIPTGKGEYFRYMIPSDYDPQGDPVPLVVGYHGYGNSAASVANQSTLDEECEARGWFMVAPTGLDDKLFGSLSCQLHIEVVIEWMLDEFNIDPDRIYMVAYSMGGGVSASFAARHRDPDGLMIAAVASACGTFDWTLAYTVHPQSVKDLLVNEFNFGDTPAAEPFKYKQCSGVYFDPATYPPSSEDYISKESMATNLAYVPTYVAYDTTDQIFSVRAESQAFINIMEEAGVQPVTQIETGTLDPCTGNPAPHSWAVFDMPAVFAFLEDKVVDRHPEVVHAQLDRDTPVSYLDVTQQQADAFTWFIADTSATGLALTDVENAQVVDIDAVLAGPGLQGPGPLPLDVTTPDAAGHELHLTGFAEPPAYLVEAGTGDLVAGTQSEPLADTLAQPVDLAGLDADLVTDALWTGDMYTTPDPAPIGGDTDVTIDMPATSTTLFIILGVQEGLVNIKGGNTISTVPFLVLPPVPGPDLVLPLEIPDDPGLAGAQLFFQTVGIAEGAVDSITNRWTLTIE